MKLSLVALALISFPALAQRAGAPPAAPANPLAGNAMAISEGQEIYNRMCTACHGKDGAAGERAPALGAPGRRYVRTSDRDLFDAISKGIPGTQMPALGLSDNDVWKVAAYIRGLRGTAADTPVQGDAARGQQIFQGKGECANCHMVRGKGGLTGPDLSDLAGQRKLSSIRDALTKADHRVDTDGGRHDAALTPLSNYRAVRITTADGKTIRGVLRNEDSFSLQVLGMDNVLHLLVRQDLREVTYEPKPLMPTDYDKRLTAEEFRDLLAYLSRLAARAQP